MATWLGGAVELWSPTLAGNLKWRSDTANVMTLDHAATAPRTVTVPDADDTLVMLTQSQELAGKTLNAAVAKGTWTASGVWTIPAVTLGGTMTATGQEITSATLNTAVTKGTWTASGTWTIPAVTLGGAMTLNGQQWTGVGVIAQDDAVTNAVTDMLALSHTTTGVAADGIGAGLVFKVEDGAGTLDEAGRINVVYTTAAHAGQVAVMRFSVLGGATRFSIDSAGFVYPAANAAYGCLDSGGGRRQVIGLTTADDRFRIAYDAYDVYVWGVDIGTGRTFSLEGTPAPSGAGNIQDAPTFRQRGSYRTNPGDVLTTWDYTTFHDVTAVATSHVDCRINNVDILTLSNTAGLITVASAAGIQFMTTAAVTAAGQTLNAAPTANTLTAANAQAFTATAARIILPAITPAANGGGITLTGLTLSQGAISNVADSEAITVTQLAITGAAGAALATGIYAWSGITITTPAQAANGAVNTAWGIKIVGGAAAGAAGAYQRGLDVTMAAETDNAILIATGKMTFTPSAADIDCILPATDARGNVGNDTYRWNLVRAVTITGGDISFENGYRFTEAERIGQGLGVALLRPDGSVVEVFR